MRAPRLRSSSASSRGSFAISRKYAASVLASWCVNACRRDTRRAYTRFVRLKPDTTRFLRATRIFYEELFLRPRFLLRELNDFATTFFFGRARPELPPSAATCGRARSAED